MYFIYHIPRGHLVSTIHRVSQTFTATTGELGRPTCSVASNLELQKFGAGIRKFSNRQPQICDRGDYECQKNSICAPKSPAKWGIFSPECCIFIRKFSDDSILQQAKIQGGGLPPLPPPRRHCPYNVHIAFTPVTRPEVSAPLTG